VAPSFLFEVGCQLSALSQKERQDAATAEQELTEETEMMDVGGGRRVTSSTQHPKPSVPSVASCSKT
jgi:hypothetical protein